MVSNFEEVITGLRQCREKLFSDNGVMGCLVSIEAEAEDIKTILSAMDDPYAYEIIFLLSRVLELIHIIHGQDLQSYDKRARELENKIQGRAYSSSSFNISDEVKTDVFVTRGSAAAGGMREPEVQLRPVEEPKVENLPPAKGLESDSPSLEKPATADKNPSRVEHSPGSTVQNGDQIITYYSADEFKQTYVPELIHAKNNSRYIPVEEPGIYNVYGFGEAKKLEREYYIKLNGGNSPAELSKGKPEFALWRPEVGEPNLDTAMTGFRDVTRHGNTVEAQVGSRKFMVTNLDEYTGTIPDDVVPTAKSLLEEGEVYWKNKDHKPAGFGNKPHPLPFDNPNARILPTHDQMGNEIKYTEYKVRRLFRNQNQVNDVGAERLVVGSDGSIYFTSTHYETFVRLV